MMKRSKLHEVPKADQVALSWYSQIDRLKRSGRKDLPYEIAEG